MVPGRNRSLSRSVYASSLRYYFMYTGMYSGIDQGFKTPIEASPLLSGKTDTTSRTDPPKPPPPSRIQATRITAREQHYCAPSDL